MPETRKFIAMMKALPKVKAFKGKFIPLVPMPYVVYYDTACKRFTGRSTALLYMLEYAEADYECAEPTSCPQTFAVEPPMVKLPCGVIISQEQAVHLTVGRQLGLVPPEQADEAQALQIALNASDMMSEASEAAPKRVQRWLDIVEQSLVLVGTGLTVGESLTYADFAMAVALEFFELNPANKKLIAAMPKTSMFLATIRALPQLEAFREKGVPLLPPR